MMKKWYIGLIIAVLSMILVACSSDQKEDSGSTEPKQEENNKTAQKEQPQKDVIIRLAGGDSGVPNPFQHHMRGPGMSKMQILYDSLLEKDEEGLIPWLAESWEESDDHLTYTFKLVDNATWHDGTPLTAEDVAFTFDYYQKFPPVQNTLLASGEYIVKSAVAKDAQTVEITFNKPNVSNLSNLGFVRILPKHIWEGVEDPAKLEGEGAVVGSGPYVFDSYNAEQGTYRYVANESYWGLKPAATAIEWVPVSDNVLAFENGEIDLITVGADLVERYEKEEDYGVKKVHSLHSYRMMFNMQQVEALQHKNIRQAMAYAIDRQGIIDKVERGSATISSMGYIPTDNEWYNSSIEQYDYNVDKATELMSGETLELELLIGNSESEVKIAELIKNDFEKVGITLNVKAVESKVRDSAMKKGEYELVLLNLGGIAGDPNFVQSVYLTHKDGPAQAQQTLKGYYNETLNELLMKQATEWDEAIRQEQLNEVQSIIADEVPVLMLHGIVDNFVYTQSKYDYWTVRYDHNKLDHNKLSYVIRQQ